MAGNTQGEALGHLRRALGNPEAQFRDGQWESIRAVVQDRSRLLLVQSTGWGKSLVYFIASRMLRDSGAGPTLLISPLLSLMRNQILASHGLVRAATINCENKEEWEGVVDAVKRGEVDVLLISPERLANEEFRQGLLRHIAGRIGLLVVDEAHCISNHGVV
jgi:ATP-dependent DNA helicase RecQ